MKENVEKALVELGLLSAHVVQHPECASEIEHDVRELVLQHKENAEYALLKVKIPVDIFDAFRVACAIFEGENVDDAKIPEYAQSLIFRAIQDFVKQYGMIEQV